MPQGGIGAAFLPSQRLKSSQPPFTDQEEVNHSNDGVKLNSFDDWLPDSNCNLKNQVVQTVFASDDCLKNISHNSPQDPQKQIKHNSTDNSSPMTNISQPRQVNLADAA